MSYPPPQRPPVPGPPSPQSWGYGPPPAEQRSGAAFGVVALIFGILGVVLPFLPVDLAGIRPIIGLAFTVCGLVLGTLGCVGQRRGKGFAAAGIALSLLGLAVAIIMLPQLL
ncbi:hypothetical protein ACFVMC_10815 [Nocardia sp. NPDC127579]|uniref:hypothetical protein n=1 Tax=Nocardia sp. NPDC127579 TaxID=3345402 RepID=UPI003643E6CC